MLFSTKGKKDDLETIYLYTSFIWHEKINGVYYCPFYYGYISKLRAIIRYADQDNKRIS